MPAYYPTVSQNILMVSVPPQTKGPLPLLTDLLISGLQQLGYQVTLVACWGHKAEGEGLFRKMVQRFMDIRQILRAAMRSRYGLVYIHSSLDPRTLLRDIPLAAGLRLLKAPTVIIFHGSELKGLERNTRSVFAVGTMLLFKLVSGVLVDSTEEQKAFQRLWPWARLGVVPQPMALDPSSDAALIPASGHKNEPVFLFAGRLIPEKGVMEVVKAFFIVKAKINCKLVIAGEGVLKADLRQMAEDRPEMRDCIEFTGYIDRNAMWNVYRRTDVLVLPTYHAEGMPTVILEAMASGLGLICTPTRGAADYLQEGKNVLFVPPQRPDLLANRMTDLLTTPNLLAEMKDNNLRMARSFEPKSAAARQIEVIQSFGLLNIDGRMVMDDAPIK